MRRGRRTNLHVLDEDDDFAFNVVQAFVESFKDFGDDFEHDPSKYGSVNFVFEANIWTVASGTAKAHLYNVTDDVVVASSEVTTTSTTKTRVRSAALTLPATVKTFRARVLSSPDDRFRCSSAKLIGDE